jgi:hypothetical protein
MPTNMLLFPKEMMMGGASNFIEVPPADFAGEWQYDHRLKKEIKPRALAY